MPLLFWEEWSLHFHQENTVYISLYFWKFGHKNVVSLRLRAEACLLTVGEATCPSLAWKCGSLEIESIQIVIVTNSSIDLDLNLNKVLFSFDFLLRKILKVDTWLVEDDNKLTPHCGQNLWMWLFSSHLNCGKTWWTGHIREKWESDL